MKQKVIITNDDAVVNIWLAKGWIVKGATPLRVCTNASDSGLSAVYHGKISYLLEKV